MVLTTAALNVESETLHKGSWNPDDESQNNDMIPHLGNAVKCVSPAGINKLIL